MKRVLFLVLMPVVLEPTLRAGKADVLIVGAGPGGLATYRSLKRQGIEAHIIEKAPSLRDEGAGIAFPANGAWALEQLGFDLSEGIKKVTAMAFVDDRAEFLHRADITKIHNAGAQFYTLTRTRLMEILMQDVPEGAIQFNTELQDILEKKGKVHVTFRTQKKESYDWGAALGKSAQRAEAQKPEAKAYDWVIACDGIHSWVRQFFNRGEYPQKLGLFVWRALIDAPEDLEHPTYVLGPDRTGLLYPLPEGKAYLYGQLPYERHPPKANFAENFGHFRGLFGQVVEGLEQTPTVFFMHEMERSHSVRFRPTCTKRVLLLGDAAHGFGPMLQNGAAQAFEDAYVLGDLLSQMPDADVPDILGAFVKRREGRVKWVFEKSNLLIRSISDPEEMEARNENIRKNGPPNVNAFKVLMRDNP